MSNSIMKQRFIEGVISQVAERGIENLRTKNIAVCGDRSESTMYNYFKGKNDMLVSAYEYADRIAADSIVQALGKKHDNAESLIYHIWKSLFTCFIDNRDMTIFMIRFRYSSYYTEEVRSRRYICSEKMKDRLQMLEDEYDLFRKAGAEMMVNSLEESALYFAEKIISGNETVDEKKSGLFRMMVNSYIHSLYEYYAEEAS